MSRRVFAGWTVFYAAHYDTRQHRQDTTRIQQLLNSGAHLTPRSPVELAVLDLTLADIRDGTVWRLGDVAERLAAWRGEKAAA